MVVFNFHQYPIDLESAININILYFSVIYAIIVLFNVKYSILVKNKF